MSAYYNEIDPYAAQWLRNLIKAGHIAPGYVDERSIVDVKPEDLTEFTQCHFFAGIGVWSYALRRAGWPDDQPVWTGSCPCQPFSAAGKGGGFDDERHLWPSFAWLIEQRRPPVIFGEQVASKAVDAWIDLVQADMEGMDYTFASTPFPSAGVGAPHIKDRNFWLANTSNSRPQRRLSGRTNSKQETVERYSGCNGANSVLADSSSDRQQCGGESTEIEKGRKPRSDVGRELPQRFERYSLPDQQCAPVSGIAGTHGLPINGFWRDADWLLCRDGKWRPVEPGTFPLADGIINRVGRLRAYGNAINAEAAKAFIESYIGITT